MDTGAWQATVHEVAMSWTQLKQLSICACMHIFSGKCLFGSSTHSLIGWLVGFDTELLALFICFGN